MKAHIFGLLVAALATPALAGGNHAGEHGEAMAVGEPGKKANATQTIRVTMKETDDGRMIFTPSTFKVSKGQTIRFAIKNAGGLDHEFVLDQKDKIMEHKAVMEKFPEMEHDDPNAIRLAAGEVRRDRLEVHERWHVQDRLPCPRPLRRRHARRRHRCQEVTIERSPT